MQAAISARDMRASRRGYSSGRALPLASQIKPNLKWDKISRPNLAKKPVLKNLIKDVATVVVPRTKINNNINNNYNTFNINNIFKHAIPKKKKKSKGTAQRNRDAQEGLGGIGDSGLERGYEAQEKSGVGRNDRRNNIRRRGVTAGGRVRRKDALPSDSKKYFFRENGITGNGKVKKKKKKSLKTETKKKSRKSPNGGKSRGKTGGKKKINQKIKRAKSIEKVNVKSKQLLRNHRSIPNLKIRREEKTDRKRKKRKTKDKTKNRIKEREAANSKQTQNLGFFSIHQKDFRQSDLRANFDSQIPETSMNPKFYNQMAGDRKGKKKVSCVFKNRRLEGKCFETMERTGKDSLMEKVKRLKFSELPKKSLKPKGKENKNSQPQLKNFYNERGVDSKSNFKGKKKENLNFVNNKGISRATSQNKKISKNQSKKNITKNIAVSGKHGKAVGRESSGKNFKKNIGIGNRKSSKKEVTDKNKKADRGKSKSKQKVFFVLKKKKKQISDETTNKKSKGKSLRKKKIVGRKRREASRKTKRIGALNFESQTEKTGEKKRGFIKENNYKSEKKIEHSGQIRKFLNEAQPKSQEKQKRTKRGLSQTGKLKGVRLRSKNQRSLNKGPRVPATARKEKFLCVDESSNAIGTWEPKSNEVKKIYNKEDWQLRAEAKKRKGNKETQKADLKEKIRSKKIQKTRNQNAKRKKPIWACGDKSSGNWTKISKERNLIRKVDPSNKFPKDKRTRLKDGTVVKKEKKRTIEEFFEQMDLKKDRSAFSDLSREQLAGLLLKARDVLKEYRLEIEKKGTSRNRGDKSSLFDFGKSFSSGVKREGFLKKNQTTDASGGKINREKILFRADKKKRGRKSENEGRIKTQSEILMQSKESLVKLKNANVKNILIEPIALNSSISISEKELLEQRNKKNRKISRYIKNRTASNSENIPKISQKPKNLKIDKTPKSYNSKNNSDSNIKNSEIQDALKQNTESDKTSRNEWTDSEPDCATNLPSLLENIVIRSKKNLAERQNFKKKKHISQTVEQVTPESPSKETENFEQYLPENQIYFKKERFAQNKTEIFENHDIHFENYNNKTDSNSENNLSNIKENCSQKKYQEEAADQKFYQQEGMRFTLGCGKKLKVLESAKKEKKKMFNIKFDSGNTIPSQNQMISERSDRFENRDKNIFGFQKEVSQTNCEQTNFDFNNFEKIKHSQKNNHSKQNLKKVRANRDRKQKIKNLELLEIRRDGSTRLEIESESYPLPTEMHQISLLATKPEIEPRASDITDMEPDFDTENSNKLSNHILFDQYNNTNNFGDNIKDKVQTLPVYEDGEEQFCIGEWKGRFENSQSKTNNSHSKNNSKIWIDNVNNRESNNFKKESNAESYKSSLDKRNLNNSRNNNVNFDDNQNQNEDLEFIKNHKVLEIQTSSRSDQTRFCDNKNLSHKPNQEVLPKQNFTTPINRQSHGNLKSIKFKKESLEKKISENKSQKIVESKKKNQKSGLSLKELTQTLQQNDRLIDSERATSLSAARRDRMYFKPDRLKDLSKEDSLRRSMRKSQELAKKRHLFKTFEESRKKPKQEIRGAYSSRNGPLINFESDTARANSRDQRNNSQVRAEAILKNLEMYNNNQPQNNSLIPSQHSLSQIYHQNTRQPHGKNIPGALILSQNPSHIMMTNQSGNTPNHIRIVADYSMSNNNSLKKHATFKTDSKSAILDSRSLINNSVTHSRLIINSKQKNLSGSHSMFKERLDNSQGKRKNRFETEFEDEDNSNQSQRGRKTSQAERSYRLGKIDRVNKEEKRLGAEMDRSITNCSVLMRAKTMQDLGISQVNLSKRKGHQKFKNLKEKLKLTEKNEKSNDINEKSETINIVPQETEKLNLIEQNENKNCSQNELPPMINLKNLKIKNRQIELTKNPESNSEPYRNLKISAKIQISGLKQSKTISEAQNSRNKSQNELSNPKALPQLEIAQKFAPKFQNNKKLSLKIPEFPNPKSEKHEWLPKNTPTETYPRGNMLPARKGGEPSSKLYSDLSIAKHSESGRIETDVSQIYQDSISKNDTPFNEKKKILSFKQSETQSLVKLENFTSTNLKKRDSKEGKNFNNPINEKIINPLRKLQIAQNILNNPKTSSNEPDLYNESSDISKKVESKTSINPVLTLGSGSIPMLETKNSEYTPKAIEMMLARRGSPFTVEKTGHKESGSNSESKDTRPCFENLIQQRVECEVSQCIAQGGNLSLTKPDQEEIGNLNIAGSSFKNQNEQETQNQMNINLTLENPNHEEEKRVILSELKLPSNIAEAKTEELKNAKQELKKFVSSQQEPDLMDLNFFKEKEPIQDLPPFNMISPQSNNLALIASDLGTFRGTTPSLERNSQKKKSTQSQILTEKSKKKPGLILDIPDSALNFKNISEKSDELAKYTNSKEGRKAIEDMIIVSLVENFLEDSLYKEIFLPSAETSDGIDTSLNRVSQYVAQFIKYLQSNIFLFQILFFNILNIF